MEAAPGLSDPALQPKFAVAAPNALDPSFLYRDFLDVGMGRRGGVRHAPANFIIQARDANHVSGLVDKHTGLPLTTRIWGYGDRDITWPGQTVQVMSARAGGDPTTTVRWLNHIRSREHLLPVDPNLHWCFSLHGMTSGNGVDYRQFSIRRDGVPMIPHLHGGHTDFQFDGNPEWFFTRNNRVKGPMWDVYGPQIGGFTNTFTYDNDVKACALWYHDHALGITRLNVYAGLAGYYFIRDEFDTGDSGNPLDLPAFPYELAYVVQDRMFTEWGDLFYSAYPGDPFYDDFINDPEAMVSLPDDLFPGGGPTALAEFFGDHMTVNGMIWPKTDVEPRSYRLRMLNGSDSRFMVLRFRAAADPDATDLDGAGPPIPFHVVGGDQGLASAAVTTDALVFEPAGRYDIVINFAGLQGRRIIMENLGADAPFGGGDLATLRDPDDLFEDSQTDRIMAFDVLSGVDGPVFDPDAFNSRLAGLSGAGFSGVPAPAGGATIRKVALFEGSDEFGRLQPLLGTVHEDAPNGYGSEATPFPWFKPTTETPELDTTEEWHIYNFTEDAHPVHIHLIHFEIVGRNELTFDDVGVQPVDQHDGSIGAAGVIANIAVGAPATAGDGYVENAPKDTVTALPGQVTKVRAHFDKAGPYVWHCHILSHEDHEMMRRFEVVVSEPPSGGGGSGGGHPHPRPPRKKKPRRRR